MTGKRAQGEALIEITASNIKATRKFPHQDHPTFSTTGNNAAGITAAKDFLTRTALRLDAAGNCPTPQL